MADAHPSEYPQTPIERWNANIEALRALKQLAAEGCSAPSATPEEAEVLARYSGFGDPAFEQAFVPHSSDPAWRVRSDQLRGLVTPAEFASIRASRPNAFHTSPEVIEEMWAGLDAMGELRERPDLRVLEPAACSGRFLTHQPPHLSAKSEHTAVELDTLSAGVLSHVLSEYPRRTSYSDAFVWNTGFQSAPLERGQHRRGPRVSLQYLHHQWVTINITNVHDPVHITGISSARYSENGTVPVAAFRAFDEGEHTIRWSLGGRDDDLWNMGSKSAIWTLGTDWVVLDRSSAIMGLR